MNESEKAKIKKIFGHGEEKLSNPSRSTRETNFKIEIGLEDDGSEF